MSSNYNAKKRHRIKQVQHTLEALKLTAIATQTIWDKTFTNLEHSLENLRDELLGAEDGGVISVTGQIMMGEIAERSAKLIREAATAHKGVYNTVIKLGKTMEKHAEPLTNSSHKLEQNPLNLGSGKHQTVSMIYDLATADGLNETGEVLKEECYLEKYEVADPYTLKQIVDDLREGVICSSLDFLETCHPINKKCIKGDLETQMITDCIETDNYGHAVDQLKMFKKPCSEEYVRDPLLLGALLIGKNSADDTRYKDIFHNWNRDGIKTQMTSFFVPHDSPLRMILRYGAQALCQLADLGINGLNSSYYKENELPLEVSIRPTHSAFTCPILKEQCSEDNPPMRLVCGHVISKDAISRITNSPRQIRTNGRHTRYKCPYCPREQYFDTAKRVEFNRWDEVEENEEDCVRNFECTNGTLTYMYN